MHEYTTYSSVLITEILYWTSVEVDLGLLAACLPTLRYLFKDFFSAATLHSLREFLPLPSASSHSKRLGEPSDRPQRDSVSTTSHTNILESGKSGNSNVEAFRMQPVGQSDGDDGGTYSGNSMPVTLKMS